VISPDDLAPKWSHQAQHDCLEAVEEFLVGGGYGSDEIAQALR
jgi:hypothetical protein